jgi:hypothetical protein
VPDIQLNAQSITTTSATTAPVAGTTEVWTVTALPASVPTLLTGQTYALVDATAGASSSQQSEVIRVTVATTGGTSITVTRGADGTTPVAHANPATFNIVVVASALAAESAYLNSLPSYAPANLRNRWDPVHCAYNWKTTNTQRVKWGVGLAERGGQSEHLAYSDSSGAGCLNNYAPAAFDRPNAWPMKIRDQVARLRGLPNTGYGIYRFVDGPNVPNYVTATGSWIGSNAYTSSTQNGATITLTPDKAGGAIDVWFYDTGTATWSVAVSGGGSKSVTQTNTNTMRKVTVLGAVAVSQQITITKTSATQTIFIGISVYTPGVGLIMHNASQSGAKAAGTGNQSWGDFTAGTGLGYIYQKVGGTRKTLTDAVFNGTNVVTSATGAFSEMELGRSVRYGLAPSGVQPIPTGVYVTGINSTTSISLSAPVAISGSAQTIWIDDDPHCIHICVGGNDHPVNTTPIATITAAITAIRNQFPNSDVILYIEEQENPSLISNAAWEAFAGAMYQLADTLDVPLIDIRALVGNYTNGVSLGLYGDDQAHLIAGAYAEWGDIVGTLIAA